MEPRGSASPDDPPGGQGMARRWPRLAIAVAAVVLVVAGLGFWWNRDRALVGTEHPADLALPSCFNSLSWTAPSGSPWFVARDAVPVGAWESEPRRLQGAVDPRTGRGQATVVRRTIGTMKIDDLDHATFTSRAGGTLAFVRATGDRRTMECRIVPSELLPGASSPYAVAFHGALAQGDPSSGDGATLVAGTVRASAEGKVVAEAPAVNGLFALYVPALGDITITGDTGGGDCASYPITIYSGVPEPVNLVCP